MTEVAKVAPSQYPNPQSQQRNNFAISATSATSPISNPQCPISNPQCPMPNAQCPISNLQSPIPNPQSPISNPQSPTRNPQPPTFNSQSPIPDRNIAPPSTYQLLHLAAIPLSPYRCIYRCHAMPCHAYIIPLHNRTTMVYNVCMYTQHTCPSVHHSPTSTTTHHRPGPLTHSLTLPQTNSLSAYLLV